MKRITFVGTLFVMALAALGIAAADSSVGWLVVGLVLLSVAIFAFRRYKHEAETETEGASGGFVAWAILFFIGAVLLIAWLQSSASVR